MTRENKVQKSERLVVKSFNRTDTGLIFDVEGDHNTHTVIVDFFTGRTSCDCIFTSLYNEKCSHILRVEKYMVENNIKEE